MIESIFVYSILGLISLLALLEVGRYRRSQRAQNTLPYPRKRLIRRLTVSALFIIDLLMIHLKPEQLSRWNELAWYLACLAIMVVVVLLIMRELHETSVAVVSEHKRFYSEIEQRMEAQIKAELAKHKKNES